MFEDLLRRLAQAGGLLLLAAAAATAAIATAAEPPRRDTAARGNDCAACHRGDQPLPARHKAVSAMKLTDCVECHEKRTDDSLVGKMNGSHLHQLAGVGCADCHGKGGQPAPVDMEQCLSCHGSGEKVSALTAKMKPQNPHTSAHYGSDLDCNVCHRQHEKSENYCAECHRWEFKVP